MRPVAADDGTLHWSERVLSALDLERLRRDVRSIILPPRTVVTPSAREWLRDHGVTVTMAEPAPAKASAWRIAQERPFAVVQSAVEALRREGLIFDAAPDGDAMPPTKWIRQVADATARGGATVMFTSDAALACCIANRLAAIRGAAVASVAQAQRVLKTLAANWIAIEMPGRSHFEVRQILKLAATSKGDIPPELV